MASPIGEMVVVGSEEEEVEDAVEEEAVAVAVETADGNTF